MSPRSGPLLCGSPHSDGHLGPAAPRPVVHLPPPPTVSLACFPTQNGSVGPACLHGHQPQVGDRPTRPTSPETQGFRGSVAGGSPRKQGSSLESSSHGPCPHIAPRPAAASSRDFQGGRGWPLGPTRRNLIPGSSPVLGCLSRRPQARAWGVAARLVGPEGGSWCDQSQCVWVVWAESRAARRNTQRPVKPEFQTDDQQFYECVCASHCLAHLGRKTPRCF